MRRVLITGAAHGLGLALARACLDRGDDVLGVDADPRVIAAMPRGKGLHLDLTTRAAPGAITDALTAPLDLVIQAAGISGTGPFQDLPPAHHARILAVNLTAPMILSIHLLREGALSETATLCFVGSVSTFTGYPGATSYAASKDGLARFTRSLDAALPRGMRASCVFPGPLRTDHARRYAPDNSTEAVARRQPVDQAARQILRGIDWRARRIYPGRTAKAMALAGWLAPRLMERVMARNLFSQLDTPRT
ncbi:MAG: SDR family NAD(P)-dependent oxidoreductase [Shimia sp.]